MSIVTTKTVNNTFLDFVDLVDTEASGEDSDEDDTATADKLGISTWPVSFLRQPPTPSDEASTRAQQK